MRSAHTGIMYCVLTTSLGCVEEFKFNISQEEKVLIVDGFISDISYVNSSSYDMDNRYFDIYLKFSSGVKNRQDELVSNAEIQVISDTNESWDYSEVEPGLYRLYFEDFFVESNRQFKVSIELENGDQYHSTFESLPQAQPMADIYFKEEEVLDYENIAGENKIRNLKGITFYSKPSSTLGGENSVNYKWDYNTTYGAIAWGLDERDINYKCWITSPLHFKERKIVKDQEAKIAYKLFFLEMNSQYIHEGYSVSFRQMVMSDLYFQFWEDLAKQGEQSDLFAPPPYNIISNLEPVGHNKPVYGYFGVVAENFHRWYFNKDGLSYYIIYPDDLQRCSAPPGPECFDCRLIGRAIRSNISNTKPIWWEE